MKNILVLGAGRSSSSLISYLIRNSTENKWQVTVGDMSEQNCRDRIGQDPSARSIYFDIHDEELAASAIAPADVVISLLPAHFHPLVAKHCLNANKHLITASYVSEEMKTFHDEAMLKGLLFLNECGLDPGIDHMSAMQIIDDIRSKGGKLLSFESFTGGLIAPETDHDNPWRYKFTWNPRNVVMAGQGTAKFLQNKSYKYIPYQQLFRRTTPVTVPGYGDYEGYANRDSLKYIETYGLHEIETMLRGTLRNKGFCSAWDVFVQLGCCDDTYKMEDVGSMSHKDFLDAFLDHDAAKSIEEKVIEQLDLDPAGPEMHRLRWAGLMTDEKIGLDAGTPAQILEHILNKKWKLNPDDKDFIVMWHRFVYGEGGKQKQVEASLVAKGSDSTYTAMAATVGLPLGIAAKLLLAGKIEARGVVIPTTAEFYEPILTELKTLGIQLTEKYR